MLAALILAAITTALQDPNLYKVVPSPTGRNGYEEYVQAAIEADRPANRALLAYVRSALVPGPRGSLPPRPKDVPEGASALDLYRIQTRAMRSVIELIRAGTEKPVFYPNLPLRADTLLVELVPLRNVARVIRDAAYCAFADGNSHEGTRLILDGLAFSKRLAVAGIIHAFVSIRTEGIMLSEIQARQGQFSLPDAQALAAWSPIGKERITDAAAAERASIRATFDDFFANPSQLLTDLEVPKEDATKMAAALRKVSREKRDYYYEAFFKRLEAKWSAVEQRLKQPEKTWLAPIDPDDYVESAEIKSDDADPDLAAALLMLVRAYAVFGVDDVDVDGIIATAAEMRVKEQIVPLYGEVLRFRWTHGRLPTTLAEAHGSEPVEVVTGRPFAFDTMPGGSFRIYAPVEGMGDVDLAFRRSPVIDQSKPPGKRGASDPRPDAQRSTLKA
jgi:hypothetical protein